MNVKHRRPHNRTRIIHLFPLWRRSARSKCDSFIQRTYTIFSDGQKRKEAKSKANKFEETKRHCHRAVAEKTLIPNSDQNIKRQKQDSLENNIKLLLLFCVRRCFPFVSHCGGFVFCVRRTWTRARARSLFEIHPRNKNKIRFICCECIAYRTYHYLALD